MASMQMDRNISMNGFRVMNIPLTPTAANDAVSKSYVDQLSGGLFQKFEAFVGDGGTTDFVLANETAISHCMIFVGGVFQPASQTDALGDFFAGSYAIITSDGVSTISFNEAIPSGVNIHVMYTVVSN